MAGYLYIFKRQAIYKLTYTGDSTYPFIVIGNPVISDIGCISHYSISSLGDTCLFLSGDGVYEFNGVTIEKVSGKINNTLQSMVTPTSSVAAVYKTLSQYWLCCRITGTSNDTVLVYDYYNKGWTVYKGIYASAILQSYNNLNVEFLLTGESRAATGGRVYQQDSGGLDNTTAIQSYWYSRWFDHGAPESRKKYKRVYVFATTAANTYSLQMNVLYDFDSGSGTAYQIPLLGSGVPLGTFLLGNRELKTGDVMGQNSLTIYKQWLEQRNGKYMQIRFSQTGKDPTGTTALSTPLTVYGFSLRPIFRAYKE
jgi:hypothetical protein